MAGPKHMLRARCFSKRRSRGAAVLYGELGCYRPSQFFAKPSVAKSKTQSDEMNVEIPHPIPLKVASFSYLFALHKDMVGDQVHAHGL